MRQDVADFDDSVAVLAVADAAAAAMDGSHEQLVLETEQANECDHFPLPPSLPSSRDTV